ncbi:MAG TPA: hypothetical protein VH643_33265 [Gemmataceae bacterium]|jgi:hypothetical protein
MRIFSSLALFVVVVLIVSADAPPAGKDREAPKDAPSKQKEDSSKLAGTFHPYNVTGPHKGHFHCLISEHGLEPMVMIFHKDADLADPLPALLKKLDAAIEKNPTARLGSFVVFLPEDLPDIAGAKSETDDARLELAKKVEQAGGDMKLKHVVLCLDTKADVEKYKLSDANLVTVVLCNKLKIVEVFALPKSEFNDAAVEKIMAAVADKLGAKRK